MTNLPNPTEQNKAIYQRFIQEVFNEGRLDRLDAFLSPAYVFRDALPGKNATITKGRRTR